MGFRSVLTLAPSFMALGLGTRLLGRWGLGIGATMVWGIGLGLTIPTANLLVADVNRCPAAALNQLYLGKWSSGAEVQSAEIAAKLIN